jgi:hypothetical protein
VAMPEVAMDATTGRGASAMRGASKAATSASSLRRGPAGTTRQR